MMVPPLPLPRSTAQKPFASDARFVTRGGDERLADLLLPRAFPASGLLP